MGTKYDRAPGVQDHARSGRSNAPATVSMLSAVAPRPCSRIIAMRALASGAPAWVTSMEQSFVQTLPLGAGKQGFLARLRRGSKKGRQFKVLSQ